MLRLPKFVLGGILKLNTLDFKLEGFVVPNICDISITGSFEKSVSHCKNPALAIFNRLQRRLLKWKDETGRINPNANLIVLEIGFEGLRNVVNRLSESSKLLLCCDFCVVSHILNFEKLRQAFNGLGLKYNFDWSDAEIE